MMKVSSARWLTALLALLPVHQLCIAQTAELEKITVFPQKRILPQGDSQRLAVIAHFTGGASKDVTRWARYQSTDDRVAGVDRTGLVSAFKATGEAWIVIRYQDCFARFRASIPRSEPVPNYKFPYQTLVDRYTHHQWKRLGFMPSDLCTDEDFIRRAVLQLTGLLPSPKEIIEFTKHADPSKRDRLIDRLLASKEHHIHFANLWADALRIPHVTDVRTAYEPMAFYKWIYESVANDKPADRFIEELLLSSGNVIDAPQIYWYAAAVRPDKLAEEASQLFLGTNLRCIKCHDHPYESWKQTAYWGLAALFAQTRVAQIPAQGKLRALVPGPNPKMWYVKRWPHGYAFNLITRKKAAPQLLDSGPLKFSFREDPRRVLSEWIQKETEPNFARATVNRYWSYFFGKGIVDSPHDLRFSNPPANPELLDALTKDFVDHHYSVKHLLQTLCKSRTYQLSSEVNDLNASDSRYFSRFYTHPMPPGIIHDAVSQLTKTLPKLREPKGMKLISNRAALFRNVDFRSRVFNPLLIPQDNKKCERESVQIDNSQMVRALFSSDYLQSKFTQADGWATQLAKDVRSNQLKVKDVFLWTLGKLPNDQQKESVLQFIKGNSSNKTDAYRQLIATLARTNEFLMIR